MAMKMDHVNKEVRNRQIMVRLTEREYLTLLDVAGKSMRKPSDMVRVFTLRGLAPTEDGLGERGA